MNENHYQLLKYCLDNDCIELWNRVYRSVYPGIKTNLRYADLCDADLHGADLCNADLQGANLQGADLDEAKLPYYQICSEKGKFVAYKTFENGITGKVLCKGERCCNLISRKIRVEKVKLLKLYGTDETTISNGNWGDAINTEYTIGEWVQCNVFCDDIRIDCAPGIHVFITRKEAEEWGK